MSKRYYAHSANTACNDIFVFYDYIFLLSELINNIMKCIVLWFIMFILKYSLWFIRIIYNKWQYNILICIKCILYFVS